MMLTSLWNDVIMNKTDGGEFMNIIHMKYAVEVARIGSINKAAEELLIAQPNLSRSIKELEADLGITIFSRTSKGMNLTPEGEEFIGYARKILDQIDDVERIYRQGVPKKQKFSISVPRASYISEAFADFSRTITGDSAELFYYETNAHRAIDNIFDSNYSLGIIRYASVYDKYFKRSLEEKGLEYELIAEFSYMLVASRESSIASLDEVHFGNLTNMIEIAHADPYVPSLPLSNVKKEELLDSIGRRIFLFERGSQFDLLSLNHETYMWVSPLPDRILDIYGLVQKKCIDNKRLYKDVLIYRKGYNLTELDHRFITALIKSKRAYFTKDS